MCGLYGTAQQQQLSSKQVEKLKDSGKSLIHRGPDNSGTWMKDGIFLGHQRLSIIDTSPMANQPMFDNDVVIAVNGEIYNFDILRQELEQLGAVFKSQSDSEVLLHGYKFWGLQLLLQRLEGMYAAVIYDQNKNKVFLIRDRVGIKPLYYHFSGSSLSWASELKGIVKYIGESSLSVNTTALLDFLVYRYIPAPKSLYKNVFKLPAAHFAEYDIETEALCVTRYWHLTTSKTTKPHDTLARELLELLRNSVEQQLVSDVPLGVLLSGGIDSSAISALASRKKSLLSFSVGFKNSPTDESHFAEIVAKQVGTEHHAITFSDTSMNKLGYKMAKWFDEPFGDTSAVPTSLVSKFARKRVTVALGGDGGDELFGGYTWYRKYKFLRKIQQILPFLKVFQGELPAWLPKKNTLEMLFIRDPVELYARLRKSLPKKRLCNWKKKLGIPNAYDPYWAYRAHFKPNLPPARAAQIIDFHTYLPDDILTKVDRASMIVSLECRPPFLSTQLIEFAFTLPESFIYKDGQLKGGLKYALRGILPETIINRKKQGFSVPDFGWRKKITAESSSVQEFLIKEFTEVG